MWLISGTFSIVFGVCILLHNSVKNKETRMPMLVALFTVSALLSVFTVWEAIIDHCNTAFGMISLSILYYGFLAMVVRFLWKKSDEKEKASKDEFNRLIHQKKVRREELIARNAKLVESGAMKNIDSFEQCMEYFRVGALAVWVPCYSIPRFFNAVQRYADSYHKELYWCTRERNAWDPAQVFKLEPLCDGSFKAMHRCSMSNHEGAIFVCDYFADGVVVYQNETLYRTYPHEMDQLNITLVEFSEFKKLFAQRHPDYEL